VHAGKQGLTYLVHALLQTRRSRDNERASAFRAQHRIHEHERDSGAMISVQMSEQDGIDAVVLDGLLRQGDEG
jgi:hypothetical protein